MAGTRGTGDFFGAFGNGSFRAKPRRDGVEGVARAIPKPALTRDAARRFQRLERLAWILDRSIPVGKWRVGLDPIIGLLPGAGDWIGAMLSVYVLYEGARLGVRGPVLLKMAGNILVETIVGTIPVLGDLFDFAWKANTRNLALVREHYHAGVQPRSLRRVGLAIAFAAVLVLTLVGLLAFLLLKGIIELFNLQNVFG